MYPVTQDQILDEAVCISHGIDIPGKGKHRTIFLPAMGKSLCKLGSLNLLLKLI